MHILQISSFNHQFIAISLQKWLKLFDQVDYFSVYLCNTSIDVTFNFTCILFQMHILTNQGLFLVKDAPVTLVFFPELVNKSFNQSTWNIKFSFSLAGWIFIIPWMPIGRQSTFISHCCYWMSSMITVWFLMLSVFPMGGCWNVSWCKRSSGVSCDCFLVWRSTAAEWICVLMLLVFYIACCYIRSYCKVMSGNVSCDCFMICWSSIVPACVPVLSLFSIGSY